MAAACDPAIYRKFANYSVSALALKDLKRSFALQLSEALSLPGLGWKKKVLQTYRQTPFLMFPSDIQA
jgi:hypothetical protein